MFVELVDCAGVVNHSDSEYQLVPTHKEIFYNKFISELKKKNPKWDKITIAFVKILLQGLSSWRKTMMDLMLALIPKEHSSQSN